MLAFVCSAAFLVFAQTFLVAPLIPQLSMVFRSPVEWVGLAVPAYVVPQAIGTLFAGPVSDRVGRRAVIFGSLLAFIAFTAVTASVRSVDAFIGWRVATGISAAGIVPIGLTLIGDLVPYARRGRAVGWLFGSIAGGTATGAALGALLEPRVGWRSLFLGVAMFCAIAVALALAIRALPPSRTAAAATAAAVLRGYRRLLAMARARRTYGYVLLNAILQSGVFTWLGVYLHRRFGLGEGGIGLVLLGYGVPGLVFGPIIGKLADRYGRARIIPAGVALTGTCALLLALPLPLNGVRVAIILLSLGFDLTHPLLAAIATDLGSVARGQAVALMAFSLFSGFGLGSLMFEAAMSLGFPGALALFGGVAWLAAVTAVFLFRRERPHAAR
ncbi:MAG: MFS transporter [Rhodanobacteraceae bacterium]|nr:MAG: MFS transporter [Rhodanobacteraceae bacterium]